MRAHRHHTATVNMLELVLKRNKRMSIADANMQRGIAMNALDSLKGEDAVVHWRSMADTANMAETLSLMNLGSGAEANRVIAAAQEALGTIFERCQDEHAWSVTEAERDALVWLIELHHVQLRACTYGEFDNALRRTAERLKQALSGNAPRGTIVVTGEIGAAA